MRYTGDIRKMRDNPTYGRVGKDGLFYVVIEAQDSELSVERWEEHEITAENVSFSDGEKILQRRLDELRAE